MFFPKPRPKPTFLETNKLIWTPPILVKLAELFQKLVDDMGINILKNMSEAEELHEEQPKTNNQNENSLAL